MRIRKVAVAIGLTVVGALALLGAAPASGRTITAERPMALSAMVRGSGTQIHNATFGAAPAGPKGPNGQQTFAFDTTPGGASTAHLAVLNITRQPERLDIYTLDAVPATNGVISFPAPNTKPLQAGAWMSVGTPHGQGYINAAPRSTTILPIHIDVPENAPPGDHVGGVIVSLASRVRGKVGRGGVGNIKFDQRIAVQADFRISGPLHPNLTVQNMSASYSGPIDPFAKGHATVHFSFHNGGNVVLGGPQSVTVHGLFGESVAGPHIVNVPALLPGATYPVTLTVHGIYPEGLMKATVEMQPKGLKDQPTPSVAVVTSSVHFFAIPLVVAIAIALLVLLVAFRIWRRRRRRAPASSQPRHRAQLSIPGAKNS